MVFTLWIWGGGRLNRREWTTKEEQFLKDNIDSMTAKEFAEELNRSVNSIKSKVHKLDLKWPKNEYAVYKGDELLAIGTAKEISEILNIKVKTVWAYTTDAYQRYNEKLDNPENATFAIKLND